MPAKTPIELPSAYRFDHVSAQNGRTYRIFVSCPADPPPEGGYKVIYALDGNASFLSFSEALRLQTRQPHGFDPAVLVSIGFPTEESFDTARRYLDYTSPADISDLPQRPDLNWGANGGADQFLDFIEYELKPMIGDAFSVNQNSSGLFGHSLGGFFVLYALTRRPHLFEAFSAASSSIWWNKGILHSLMAKELPDRLAGLEKCPRLMMSIGGAELEDMRVDTARLYQSLENTIGTQMCVKQCVVHDEDHISVLPALISRTIAFFLSPTGHRKPHSVMSPGKAALNAIRNDRNRSSSS